MNHVIKSSGKVQEFSFDKLTSSVTKSLHAVHVPNKEVVIITATISTSVTSWLRNKHEVTTKDIRTVTARELAKYNKDAAVLYKKHKELW